MFPVKKCKRLIVMLVLLAFAGQSLAFTVSFCRMADQNPVTSMAEDASIHAVHGHEHDKDAGDAVKSEASDCCANGDSGCSMSGCVSFAMMPAPQQIALPYIRIELPIYSLDPAQSQYPSSLYRPPISL